ncbi:LysR family transcriptional regulator [Oerskovia flava]|uniref:LysR family transcriptional regulator n=1 Tax=Oerskovia flava TaxID=2986422 RepID=UPI002240281B|nr:LysR family transcriptional regulator [Oerskovia sp. JB1-3-2]
MDLELRHLRMIVTVAEHGSVTKAAATLGIAQPALTAQLNRIDRVLGGCVFTRDQRGARPTALGQLVLSRARVLLPAMAALEDDARRLVNRRWDHGAPLRVGTVSTAIAGLFVNRVVTALPGTRVSIVSSASADDIALEVAAGTLDVALVGLCADAPPPSARGVVWRQVCVDPVFVLLAAGHPHAERTAVDLADLADEVWLHAPGSGCFERCFASECARAGFSPTGLSEVDRAACVDQVRAGHAVALVQPVFPETPGVRAVPLAGSPLRWAQYVGWHADVADQLPVGVIADAAAHAHDDAVARSPRYLYWLDRYGEART